MPKHIPALATRAAVVATTTAAVAVLAVLPVTTASATPASGRVLATPVAVPATLPAPAPATMPTLAMDLALSKIGSQYRWGAAGPNAFDCSGLVTWAFHNVGIPLPRSSRAMSRVGTPVPKADLRPGDLVFFYRPVSHVGIYVGDGRIVHASTRRSPVQVSDISRMPFHSARRV